MRAVPQWRPGRALAEWGSPEQAVVLTRRAGRRPSNERQPRVALALLGATALVLIGGGMSRDARALQSEAPTQETVPSLRVVAKVVQVVMTPECHKDPYVYFNLSEPDANTNRRQGLDGGARPVVAGDELGFRYHFDTEAPARGRKTFHREDLPPIEKALLLHPKPKRDSEWVVVKDRRPGVDQRRGRHWGFLKRACLGDDPNDTAPNGGWNIAPQAWNLRQLEHRERMPAKGDTGTPREGPRSYRYNTKGMHWQGFRKGNGRLMEVCTDQITLRDYPGGLMIGTLLGSAPGGPGGDPDLRPPHRSVPDKFRVYHVSENERWAYGFSYRGREGHRWGWVLLVANGNRTIKTAC